MGRVNLKLRLLLTKHHVVAMNEVHKRARVCLLSLHVVPFNVFDVFFARDPCTLTSKSLNKFEWKERACMQRELRRRGRYVTERL
jgi:hypothetical protein